MDSDGRKQTDKPKKIRRFLMLPFRGLHGLTSFILRKVLGENYGEVTEDDILSMVDAGNESGLFEETSVEMINNVFEFNDLKAADVMTHRVNITGVDESADIDEIIYLALDKGYSRIPVYRDSVDKIIGIIIVKDLLSLIGDEDYKSINIGEFLRETVYIPEACSCADAFKFLNNMKAGMAVVVDEYGGTAGILTLEDIIEAIMGNIEDEYDDESDDIRQIGKDKYEVDGEADPDDVLELFGYELPEDHEYDTIAGFVTDLFGYIPSSDEHSEHIDYKGIRFVVKEVDDNCISKVLAIKIDELEVQ